MSKKTFTAEQIIVRLREVEVLCSQGKTVAEAARQIGVTEQTYYRWRKQFGGMNSSDAKRLKELEKENARLKKLVAGLSLDNAILKDVARENSKPGKMKTSRSQGADRIRMFPADGLPGTKSIPQQCQICPGQKKW